MCFSAPTSKCKLQEAKQDIIVYKVVKNLKYKRYFWHPWDKYLESVQSVIMGFTYKVYQYNKPITLNPQIRLDYININEGYYSYTTLNNAVYTYPSSFSGYYHVVKCVIPKGSHYYEDGQICVSSNIIITDKLCEKLE